MNSFLHSGLEGVTRGMDISNRARPRSSKAEKDLERAALGSQKITSWMNKTTAYYKVPLKTEESEYTYLPKQNEALEWSGSGLLFLEYFPKKEFETRGKNDSVKISGVCGTAPVLDDTAVVRCVKDEGGYVERRWA